MKKLYTSPEAEVVEFDVLDVITTSFKVSDDPNDYEENNDDWSDWF